MNKREMTPTRLRLTLAIVMLALVTIGVSIFSFGYGELNKYAASARTIAANAQASNSSLQNLATLQKELADQSESVKRASLLVAESKSYLYQDQIITDINQYAAAAGISVTNITFTSTTAVANATAATKATAEAAPAGTKSMTATVSLKNPIDYMKMLTFIHYIEQSLFKMRISQVSLSKASATSGNDITSDILTIEVYVR